jgi:hypothetical protein
MENNGTKADCGAEKNSSSISLRGKKECEKREENEG